MISPISELYDQSSIALAAYANVSGQLVHIQRSGCVWNLWLNRGIFA
jgi:hypothetical protein